MILALQTGQPLTGPGGLESWHPRDVATLAELLDEKRRAANEPAAREKRLELHGLA